MKRKAFLLLMICAGILTALLAALSGRMSGLFPTVLSFPLEPIAAGLKALTETGAGGNGLAAALWIGLGMIPALSALRGPKAGEARAERAALFVLSGFLLAGLYGMMNPWVFVPRPFAGDPEFTKTVRSVFDVSVWAALTLYVVLHLVRLFRAGSKERLLGYLRILLRVLCILFTAAIAVSLISGLRDARAAQTGADRTVAVFGALADAVPYGMDIAVLLSLLELIAVASAPEQPGLTEATGKLTRLCCLALGISAALPVLLNGVQILLMPRLTDISVTSQIPVVSIVLVAVILLLSRLLTENKKLRDDNSLFI